MASQIILVNGLPAAGKTTLATALTRVLDVPMISRDAVKEALYDALDPRIPIPKLAAFASASIWQLAGFFNDTVILESFWLKDRDLKYVQAGLQVAGAGDVVEIWCDAPPAVSRQRYISRLRDGVHGDPDRLQEYARWVAEAVPLHLCPVITVNTEGDVDVIGLGEQLRHHVSGLASR